MLRLTPRFAAMILSFAPLFFQRSWRRAELLLMGAILALGIRTVSSLLRTGGRAVLRENYHRVLNQAVWGPQRASSPLLSRLIETFAPAGPVVLGIDHAVEHRSGKRIAAKGIYRDPGGFSHGLREADAILPVPIRELVGRASGRLRMSRLLTSTLAIRVRAESAERAVRLG